MRTTIELSDEHRGRLLELAARRGLKGFSVLVQEAVDMYLKRPPIETASLREFRKLRGSIPRERAERLRAVATRIRTSWR